MTPRMPTESRCPDATYSIDGERHSFSVSDTKSFARGQDEVLVEKFGDLCSSMPWFEKGFVTAPVNNFVNIDELRQATQTLLATKISETSKYVSIDKLELENYHRHVNDEQHSVIVEHVSKLTPSQMSINSLKIISSVSKYLNRPVSFTNHQRGRPQHVVLRCVRPKASDFNPPHKDTYGIYDEQALLPHGVNLWIPICGVAPKSSLCVVPGSHLLPESVILRSPAKSTFRGKVYHVNWIKSWKDCSSLVRIVPSKGQLLIFTPNLIHGLGINDSEKTRIVLEIRLYAHEREEKNHGR